MNQRISTILLDLVDELNNVTDDVDISMNGISKDETEERLRALGNRKAAPPRLKLTLPWLGGFPPRSFKPSASTRRAQLSVAAKVVRPTDLLKNVRY